MKFEIFQVKFWITMDKFIQFLKFSNFNRGGVSGINSTACSFLVCVFQGRQAVKHLISRVIFKVASYDRKNNRRTKNYEHGDWIFVLIYFDQTVRRSASLWLCWDLQFFVDYLRQGVIANTMLCELGVRFQNVCW